MEDAIIIVRRALVERIHRINAMIDDDRLNPKLHQLNRYILMGMCDALNYIAIDTPYTYVISDSTDAMLHFKLFQYGPGCNYNCISE